MRVNSVAPGSSIYSPTASANYGDAFAPFEIARPGVPAKRLGTTMEVRLKTICPFPLIVDAWPFFVTWKLKCFRIGILKKKTEIRLFKETTKPHSTSYSTSAHQACQRLFHVLRLLWDRDTFHFKKAFFIKGAARAGVENLSRSLAVEWAGEGMRVNCVAPGVVFSASAEANYDFDILGGSIPGIPAKRLGLPQEVTC